MNLKALLTAGVVALSPLAVSAATVNSSGVAGGCAAAIVDGSIASIDALAGATWNAVFDDGEAGATCNFDVVNTSGTDVIATVSVATVNQNGLSTAANSWGFLGGVDLSGVAVSSWAEGEFDTRIFNFLIGAGQTVFFDWTWGEAYTSGLAKPDIDFTLVASPIPLPAGVLLMGTALAGFGVMRRRKKAA